MFERAGILLNGVLRATQENEDDDDDEQQSQPTARIVAPPGAVRPRRERSEQRENYHDQQNKTKQVVGPSGDTDLTACRSPGLDGPDASLDDYLYWEIQS